MRKANAAWVLALASLAAGPGASAQQAQPTPGKYKPQPLNLHREASGPEAFAEIARARQKKGDCAGALEAFDAAIRTSMDATLRRDRGLCQEALGHAYPAIDDYRAYLTAAPDAPDADSIRERLVKLEQGSLGYSSASSDKPGDVEGGASAHESTSGAPAKVHASTRVKSDSSRDPLDYVDREEDPLQASLRRGKGWSFAPFFSEHKWGASPARIALNGSNAGGYSFDDAGTWSECVGLEFRYSFGRTGALIVEAAYEHFNSTAVDLAIVSGLSSQVGYEWRFPLDSEYDNQFILAPGLGYEHLVIEPGDAQTATISAGAFVPRVRFGWRHLLAPSAGLDVSADGGIANFFTYGNFPFDSNSSGATSFLVALNIAMVWGL